MGTRLRPGDVLELTTDKGRICVHYVGRHSEYGDGVIVCPTLHASRAPVNNDLFREGYFTFYPAAAAVGQSLANVIGNLPSPGLPKRFRRPGARYDRTITTWIVEDGAGEVVKQRLSEEERRLPIAAIWNHEMLLHRVSEGWRPEIEGQ